MQHSTIPAQKSPSEKMEDQRQGRQGRAIVVFLPAPSLFRVIY